MGAWSEKKRMIARCDCMVDNGVPVSLDPYDEDDSLTECTATNSMSLMDLKTIDFGSTGWFNPERVFHKWLTEILDPPWLVENTGYATGLGNTYRYTCPECLFEKQYPY